MKYPLYIFVGKWYCWSLRTMGRDIMLCGVWTSGKFDEWQFYQRERKDS